jgi:hypothetical protein
VSRGVRALAAAACVAVAGHAAGQAPTAPPSVAPSLEYLFPSGAGLLFFHVRPERAADFEAVVARLSAALDASTDPVRRQQGASWRVFRSVEIPRDVVLYLFVFDPAVAGADYDPVRVLSEALPLEAQGLYDRLRASVVRVERMGLMKMR